MTNSTNEARDDKPLFRRASGRKKCEVCGKQYREHPWATEYEYDDRFYLRRLCDGTLVKL